jgi:hypothetical protein
MGIEAIDPSRSYDTFSPPGGEKVGMRGAAYPLTPTLSTDSGERESLDFAVRSR